ncbi:translation initiation factor IF-2 [Bubalus bubalis]|uniref:translation initiation factor IF-2 n=1 Tax=Bubalus bubalis TaxID=89462 RepID=UPI001D0FC90B|nr:translation initiation factor IF-2 [Bubalus bubalis]
MNAISRPMPAVHCCDGSGGPSLAEVSSEAGGDAGTSSRAAVAAPSGTGAADDRGPSGGARGGRSRPGQGSRCAGPKAWAPGAFPAGAVRCRRRRRRRCCWSRCRCWNSCRDFSMFLSSRSPQPRHPAPTPPGSHSPEPTPGASRQAPAANPGEGTPLSGFPPHPTPSPGPRQLLAPRLHRRFCGSRESGADRQASASPALAGSCPRVPSRARLAPVPSSPRLPIAPGFHPAPSLGPQSPLSCAPFASGVWFPPAPRLYPQPPIPSTSSAQVSCRAERVFPIAGRGLRCSRNTRAPWTVCLLGVEESGCKIVSCIGQPRRVCVKPFFCQEESQPARVLPARGSDRRRV